MGQIVQNPNNPVRCNLQAIQTGGSQANTVIAAGEIWLVDTNNTQKSAGGYGKYDAYVVGDGSTAANALIVKQIGDEELATYTTIVNTETQRAVAAELTKANSSDVYTKNQADAMFITAHQDISGKADKSTTLAGYGITNAYTKDEVDTSLQGKQSTLTFDITPTTSSTNPVTSGGVKSALDVQEQSLRSVITNNKNDVDSRLSDQDAAIELLNGSEVIVVTDHTSVSVPDSQKIYREQGSASYSDYMYQDGSWKLLGIYSFPGIDNFPMPNSNNLTKSGGINSRILDSETYLTGLGNKQQGFISSNDTWSASSGYGICIPTAGISSIELYKITNDGVPYYAFLTENVYKTGTLSFVSGYSGRQALGKGSTNAITSIPEGCKYIWLLVATGSASYSIAPADLNLVINDIDVLQPYIGQLYQIGKDKRMPKLGYAIPISGSFNYTPNTKTLTLPTSLDIVSQNGTKRYTNNTPSIVFSSGVSREQVLVFNTTAGTFRTIDGAPSGSSQAWVNYVLDDVILGTVDTNGTTGKYFFNFNYTVNNADVIRNEYDSVPTVNSSKLLTSGTIFEALSPVRNLSSLTTKVADVENFIGDPDYNQTPISITTVSGGMKGEIGATIVPQTTDYYNYCVLNVIPGEKYRITLEKSTSSSYTHYIHVTDDNGYILQTAADYSDSDNYEIVTVDVAITDNNATKLYITTAVHKKPTPDVLTLEALSLHNIIDKSIKLNDGLSDGVDCSMLSIKPFILSYLEEKYWPSEQAVYNALVSKINARKGTGKYQIAFITDTHESGFYSLDGYTTLRSIALYNKLSSNVDICMHGGDITCDYGLSLAKNFAYMTEVMKLFKLGDKNLLMCKGNHDTRDGGYEEINPVDVDWDNGDYYTNYNHRSSFTKIDSQNPYRGGAIYIESTEKTKDSLFKFLMSTNIPNNIVWGNGAYYYYDENSVKVRFVVLNSYPIDDNGDTDMISMWNWFTQTALNLSSKQSPTDWLVIVLRHTQTTASPQFVAIADAFIGGTAVTVNGVTTDFGTINGGGIPLLNLHGHEHSNCGYSNGAGHLDIGFKSAAVDVRNLGNALLYGLYVLTIDTVNKKLISDDINGESFVYDYINNIVELSVGQTIQVARSNISAFSAATWNSSNNSIATVSNGRVTAIEAGTATITGTEASAGVTVVYTVKVL